ncbi:glycosyl transferase group 1 [Thalassoporum mexicanum PCC 7367]|uniref:glycosyltransferase family 4 protein n=1 Tax=Thalassoporum mexicanum TaxID=3457544 RepID=UPI00029FFA5E|nr:glycosyltransferase family 4 protein [Pseudanabaena sp. PCC 7367]AFY71009.1 glycosyl transferase group 1 [Pseudanabaena sp. PCC 7367]
MSSLIPPTERDRHQELRIAWLLQVAGHYWQPIMGEFTSLFPRAKVFTANWPGFIPGFEDSFQVEQVGTIKVYAIGNKTKQSKQSKQGYGSAFASLSLRIGNYLLKFKPQVVFTTGFSIWTIIAILLKGVGNWKVVIVYDGSTPGVDYSDSTLRLRQRRLMRRFVDAFITNNQAGQAYLVNVVGAEPERVFARPYLIPHQKAYDSTIETVNPAVVDRPRPIFLFAGQVIPRKGLQQLLQACVLLNQQGYQNYTILVVGDGAQRQELAEFVAQNGLSQQVAWAGHAEYTDMGAYFHHADVFILSSLEEVWGLVVVEAMLFAKPILCSQGAGAAEMIKNGENGYVFDPLQPQQLADLMRRFIDQPDAIAQMGQKSQQIMTEHTPEAVAQHLGEVVDFVLSS